MQTDRGAIEPFERTFHELIASGAPEPRALRSAARVWLWHHPGCSLREAERAVEGRLTLWQGLACDPARAC